MSRHDSHTMKATRYDHISCSHHRLLLYLNLLLLLLYGRVLLFPGRFDILAGKFWEISLSSPPFNPSISVDMAWQDDFSSPPINMHSTMRIQYLQLGYDDDDDDNDDDDDDEEDDDDDDEDDDTGVWRILHNGGI